jgi:hypothetical protein
MISTLTYILIFSGNTGSNSRWNSCGCNGYAGQRRSIHAWDFMQCWFKEKPRQTNPNPDWKQSWLYAFPSDRKIVVDIKTIVKWKIIYGHIEMYNECVLCLFITESCMHVGDPMVCLSFGGDSCSIYNTPFRWLRHNYTVFNLGPP